MGRSVGAAVLGVALLLGAAAFDSPSLFVPGLVLLSLGGGAGVWVLLASAGARLRRVPGPPSVEEEQPYPLRMRLSAGLLRPPGGELHEPLLDRAVPLRGLRSRRVRVDVRFSRRGRRTLEPARLVIRDPLWLAVRERAAGERVEVVVLPRIEPVLAADGGGAGGMGAGDSQPRLGVAASEMELDGLRPYRAGSPASRIHWPTVARTGELLERRLVPDADARPLIVVDARRPASGEALDAAVRAAASLAVRLARAGGCSLLLPGDRRPAEIEPELRSWPGLHLRLALLEESEDPPAAARLQRAGAVLWVCATASERLPAGLERSVARARYLVTPAAAPAGTPAFSVAGCIG